MAETIIEMLEESIEEAKKDDQEVRLYSEYMRKALDSSMDEGDKKRLSHVKRFVMLAARIESRIHPLTKKLVGHLDKLEDEVHTKHLREQIETFEKMLMTEDSRSIIGVAKGTIPELLKADSVNWEAVKEEMEKVIDIITSMEHLFKELIETLSQILSIKSGVADKLAA